MQWLTSNWHNLVPGPWLDALLALVAALCGALVGTERQRREKPAGIRTMALVGLGAAVFTMIGFVFAGANGDAGRVAAQIVTGIGFLGGGVIMRGPGSVLGTTTAATIWVVAAIGVIVGAGYVGPGLGLVALVLGVLGGVGRWEHSLQGGGCEAHIVILFDPAGGKTLIKLEKVLDEFAVSFRPKDLAALPDRRMRLRIDYRLPGHRHFEFLNQLAALPEVLELER